jgi:hypothetical protein
MSETNFQHMAMPIEADQITESRKSKNCRKTRKLATDLAMLRPLSQTSAPFLQKRARCRVYLGMILPPHM